MKKKLTLRLGQTIKCQVGNEVFVAKIIGFGIYNNKEVIDLDNNRFVYSSQIIEIINN